MANNEIKLKEDTLITSKTDLNGKIVYANHDFLKYAGYTMDEVLNKPHNIVRHKDMPKSVFKFLWDYVKSKKEIFAFVKNKTKDNDYYWVFANITPSLDINDNVIGYYSVRRMPNENIIKQIIEPLYKELLYMEEKQGMQASVEAINDICEKNQKSYNEFIFSLQNS